MHRLAHRYLPTVSDAIKAKALPHKMGDNKGLVLETLLEWISEA